MKEADSLLALQEIALTQKEFDVLSVLAQGDATRTDVQEIVGPANIPNLISSLKEKLKGVVFNLTSPPNPALYSLHGNPNISPEQIQVLKGHQKSEEAKGEEVRRQNGGHRAKVPSLQKPRGIRTSPAQQRFNNATPEAFKRQRLAESTGGNFLNTHSIPASKIEPECENNSIFPKGFLEGVTPTERRILILLSNYSQENPFKPEGNDMLIIEVLRRDPCLPTGLKLIKTIKDGLAGYYLQRSKQ